MRKSILFILPLLLLGLAGCADNPDLITGSDAYAMMEEWDVNMSYVGQVEILEPDVDIDAQVLMGLRVRESQSSESSMCFTGRVELMDWEAPISEDYLPNGCMELIGLGVEPDFEHGELNMHYDIYVSGNQVGKAKALASKANPGALNISIMDMQGKMVEFPIGTPAI